LLDIYVFFSLELMFHKYICAPFFFSKGSSKGNATKQQSTAGEKNGWNTTSTSLISLGVISFILVLIQRNSYCDAHTHTHTHEHANTHMYEHLAHKNRVSHTFKEWEEANH
jgi:hypothetical protein